MTLRNNIIEELRELSIWYYREKLPPSFNLLQMHYLGHIYRQKSSQYLESRNIDFNYFEKSFLSLENYSTMKESLEFSPSPITFVNENNIIEFIFLTFYFRNNLTIEEIIINC